MPSVASSVIVAPALGGLVGRAGLALLAVGVGGGIGPAPRQLATAAAPELVEHAVVDLALVAPAHEHGGAGVAHAPAAQVDEPERPREVDRRAEVDRRGRRPGAPARSRRPRRAGGGRRSPRRWARRGSAALGPPPGDAGGGAGGAGRHRRRSSPATPGGAARHPSGTSTATTRPRSMLSTTSHAYTLRRRGQAVLGSRMPTRATATNDPTGQLQSQGAGRVSPGQAPAVASARYWRAVAPRTWRMSSSYLRTTPSVSSTRSGASSVAPSDSSAAAQSSVSATPGHLGQVRGPQAVDERDDLAREAGGRVRHAGRDDLELLGRRRVVDPVVQAAALERVVDLARPVRREHDARRLRGADRADLGHGDLEVGQDLEQVGLELLVGAVDLVDQQDRGGTRRRPRAPGAAGA